MVISIKSISELKMGHEGSKIRSLGQFLEKKHLYNVEGIVLKQFHETMSIFFSKNIGQDRNCIISDQKLGH